MSLILLPSFLAICLKITIFFRYQKSLTRENFALLTFFAAVFTWNLVELIFLDGQHTDQVNMLLLLAAYCSIVFVIHSYLSIAIEYSKPQSKYLPQIKTALNVLLGYLIVSLIFDRGFIEGYIVNGYTLTKDPGARYWIFQIYFLTGIIAAISLLVKGWRNLPENIDRQRCMIVLFSTLPAVGVGVGVVVSQAMGFETSSTIFQSLGFTVMLGMMVYVEENSRLFRLLTFIPFTKERKLHKKILSQITTCIAINDDPSTQQPINLKHMMREFEGLVVEHVLEYYQGNQKLTASALGVSEATISRRARATSSSVAEDVQPSTKPGTSLADECLQQSVRITQ